MVADRREKFVQQITVSCVDLKDFEPCFKSAPGSGLERVDDGTNPRLIQGDRRRMSFVERNRTRTDYWPAVLLGRKPCPSFPSRVAALRPAWANWIPATAP